MPEHPPTIENLVKVTLNIKNAESSADDDGRPFEFIYGVGPSGITPFEKALFGKGVGDRIKLHMVPSTLCETVGHLEIPVGEQTGMMAPVSLEVTVIDLVRAQDREVIKALATVGNCGDCGCGCGGQ